MTPELVWTLLGVIAVLGALLLRATLAQAGAARTNQDLLLAVTETRVRLEAVRMYNDELLRRCATLRREHLDEIERMMTLHREELDRLGNMVQSGRPVIPDAEALPPRPDAELRMLTSIREDQITRGAEQLKAMYAESNLVLSDEEARLQANAMLQGEPLDTLLGGGTL